MADILALQSQAFPKPTIRFPKPIARPTAMTQQFKTFCIQLAARKNLNADPATLFLQYLRACKHGITLNDDTTKIINSIKIHRYINLQRLRQNKKRTETATQARKPMGAIPKATKSKAGRRRAAKRQKEKHRATSDKETHEPPHKDTEENKRNTLEAHTELTPKNLNLSERDMYMIRQLTELNPTGFSITVRDVETNEEVRLTGLPRQRYQQMLQSLQNEE